MNGFIATDKEKIKMAQTFNANKLQILTKIVIPSNIPTFFNTLKVNIGLTLVGVISGEFLVSKGGLGYLIVYGGQVFQLDLVMTSVIILAFLAALMYESIVIINPKLEEKENKDLLEKYKKMIEEFSNREVTVEDLGEKKLAYEIQKNNTGRYALFNFFAEPENIYELERNYRIDDNIMKFIVVRQDELEYDESADEEEEY